MTNINETYVKWANTLDSAGEDSGPARERMKLLPMVENLHENMLNIIRVGQEADMIKKFIFYGKTCPELGRAQILLDSKIDEIVTNLDDRSMMRVYHAILGLVTEASELMEMFQGHIAEGIEFDWQNLTEEVGDLFWYLALLAKAQGYGTFVPYLSSNRAKLVARYGDKWDQDRAINRDTDNEMAELDKALVEWNIPNGYTVRGANETIKENDLYWDGKEFTTVPQVRAFCGLVGNRDYPIIYRTS